MEQILKIYYKDGAKKLHDVIDNIFRKFFGGIYGKDMEEYYGIGTDVFAEILVKNTYDSSKGDFDGYIYNSLKLAFIDEFKRQNRDKRTSKIFLLDKEGNKVLDEKTGKPIKIPVPDIRLDAPIKDDESITLRSLLPSDFDIDNKLSELIVGYQDENVEKYLSSLPSVTRQVIEMKMNDIPVFEIKEKLDLTENEYQNHINVARMNENLALFTKRSNRHMEDYKMENIIPIDVTDNYRMDKFPLGSLLDDMKDGKINKKYILQRKPYQWTERQKNKFLTRVLNGQPIPEIVICEQTVKGKKKSHLIDGLQRLSYSELFRCDGIVVKMDGAEFYEIPYREYQYDCEGNPLLDEDGDALFEEKTFNVIDKKFSELPQFLKERFNKFNINVTTYFKCTDAQIAYHIRNYNNQEGMNKSQYEFTDVDVNIAAKIKEISENHSFFKDDYGKYTKKNKIKGDVDKVVVESIMAINFLGNWKKEVKDSFSFVNSNVKDFMFDSFKNSLDRLCKIVDKEIKNIFTTTNSPIWFAVFEKFKTFNLPDVRFKDFVKYVNDSLDTITIEGELFKDIYKSKNTRDKRIVTGKVNGLISLMCDFLEIDGSKYEESYADEENFISEMLHIDLEEVYEDMEFYNESLDDLIKRTKMSGSKLLDKQNRLSLLTMVVYSYQKDVDLENWLINYKKNNNTYIIDQKKNFLHMKNDFEKSRSYEGEKSA